MNYIISYNIKKLIEMFEVISDKKWIKGINNYTNSVGLTFESQLNKQSDSMYFPDYNGIEIKCTQRYSNYPLSLFSVSFDGPFLYEMNRLLSSYGKSDVIYKDKKLLMATLSCKNKVLVNKKYYFKLDVSDIDKKIYLEIYDINMKLIEKSSFLCFETIKQRLELKLSNLALVWASKKILNNDLYFRYYKIAIYRLISFEKFIELLKQDIIKVDIIGRISRSGTKRGKQRNKNLVFKINKQDITHLFESISIHDKDLEENRTKFI